MAIRIECSQCGYRNDLGRVFCTQCGQKLDMRRTTMADMRDRREFEIGPFLRGVLGTVLVAGFAAIVGLAAWPMSPASVPTDQAGAVQVPIKAGAMKRALAARQRVSIQFSEAELNGYLAAKAKARKLDLLTIDLKPGAFDLDVRTSWQSVFTNATWLKSVPVPVSLNLMGTFDEGRLVVRRTHLGHLPLIGPASGPVQTYFAGVFGDIVAEKGLTSALTQVGIDETKAELKLGK